MSDQPENPNAETTQFEAVQPEKMQQPVVGAAKTSNGKVIMAAVGGAIAVAVIALAGVVGFAIGSHHSNNRPGFGSENLGQFAQNFERHHNQMMDGLDPQGGQAQGQGPAQGQQQDGPGSMMGPNQQDQGPSKP
ncbi:MAG: hypothetical protein WCK04_05405 [Actinomycetes bacterium]